MPENPSSFDKNVDCGVCGLMAGRWRTGNDLWAAVVGTQYAKLCAGCFIAAAEQLELYTKGHWVLMPPRRQTDPYSRSSWALAPPREEPQR